MNAKTVTAILQQQNTPAARFTLAAMKVREAHGGRPTATIEDGVIVFDYPDGTRTVGGVTVTRGGRS